MLIRNTPGQPAENGAEPGLHGDLSTPKVAALSLSAAAPLVAIAGTVPLSMSIGNGAGVPGTYLLATLTLLCFAVGYAAISRRVASTGGFYTYVLASLGRPPAAAAGVLALIAYNALVVALAGGIGYFTGLVIQMLWDRTLPWWPFSLLFIAVMAVMGYRKIDLSGRVLAVLMTFEIAILTALDIAIVAAKGAAAFPTEAFAPRTVFSGAPGVALMFAFGSFCGFEAIAVYARETRRPARSIPRATYASVVVIGIFFCLTSWLAVGAVGVDQARATAEEKQGLLFLSLARSYVGTSMMTILAVLIVTSAFACLLAAHNAASRYLYTLGREGLMPRAVGRAHPRHRSPHAASLAQSTLCIVIVTAYAVAGLDPYRNLTTTMSGVSTLGIVLLEVLVSCSVVVYFWRDPARHWWRTTVAPAVGGVGLMAATVLIWANFDTLAGTDSVVVNSFPWLVVVLALAAALWTLRLRRSNPLSYALLGSTVGEPSEGTAPRQAP
ncbi:amino acid/polyamine/organocation transporter (APC superfamily) [Streptomyces sp. TLI_235]|nr:APC family permease [Streptomyces sp. TLI_235]PBC69566.1 amino acid/polyamine/organocation transporter (APC superfamily) [Streptomyces sp. TLI_235]